ncbi:MAG TPA: PrsW family glutamic-type intramembrane protease [Vicinamibacterales bacterium]|nr:PrsW family glutamic-type intramembrane protease [Vicinamibacterales bacterium]
MNVALAIVPVLILLALLQLMDTFKLVRLTAVLATIAAGALVALFCLPLHDWLLDATGMRLTTLTRYVAPLTEETLKGLVVIMLLWRRRIGFLVDGAVHGFAVGTGFAIVENIDYLSHLANAPLLLWFARGLGTATLHGTLTALFAIGVKTMMDRGERRLWIAAAPGLALVIGIHAAFNHLPLPPLALTLLVLMVMPWLMIAAFQRSERATREWVGAGLDLDIELLDLIKSELFAATRFGAYLQELRARFGGIVVADMFCLLRLELELAVQAKAMLLARDAGLAIPVTPDLHASLQELRSLQASIGRTGLLALNPLQVSSDRDRWHRYLLAAEASSRTGG